MPLDAPSTADYTAWQNSGILIPGQPIAPVRNGMDRYSGRLKSGWSHVLQSIEMLFETRYHERILREWVGSFVGHLLGENITESTIARFFWAISTAISLWEPDYKVNRVLLHTPGSGAKTTTAPTTTDSIRAGAITLVTQGTYYPRGHLGDFTPDIQRSATIVGRGGGHWRVS